MATDPRELSDDQRELLAACEALALLTVPVDEDEFEPLADHACDLLEARGQAFRGDLGVTIRALLIHEHGLRAEGFPVAADGVRLMVEVWGQGYMDRTNPQDN